MEATIPFVILVYTTFVSNLNHQIGPKMDHPKLQHQKAQLHHVTGVDTTTQTQTQY